MGLGHSSFDWNHSRIVLDKVPKSRTMLDPFRCSSLGVKTCGPKVGTTFQDTTPKVGSVRPLLGTVSVNIDLWCSPYKLEICPYTLLWIAPTQMR